MQPTRPIRATVALATLAGMLAISAATAAAATTVETSVTRGIVLDVPAAASRTCGFPIELHTVGMDIAIRRYDASGNLVAMTLQQHYDGYLLNPANGKTISSRVSGPIRDVFHADGTITETTSGATIRTAPGAGLVSGFIGHESVTLVPTGEVDEDGFPIYDFTDDTVNGQFLGNGGVCAILS